MLFEEACETTASQCLRVFIVLMYAILRIPPLTRPFQFSILGFPRLFVLMFSDANIHSGDCLLFYSPQD